jgi:hypothetical protein
VSCLNRVKLQISRTYMPTNNCSHANSPDVGI